MWGVTNSHPWVVPVDGGVPARDLAPDWALTCGSTAIGDVLGGGASGPHWEKDGKSLLVLASDREPVDVYGEPERGHAAARSHRGHGTL